MTDYISREAALQAVDCGNLHRGIVSALKENIKSIPAADVRPVRRGKWNIVKLPPDPGYKAKECSSCKCNFWDLEEWNFCPFCGADVRGEGDA